MKILILAQNPKNTFNILLPMVGTKSYKTLMEWMTEAGVLMSDCEIQNAVNVVGNDASYLGRRVTEGIASGEWVDTVREYPIIVCLGSLSKRVIVQTCRKYLGGENQNIHFFLPHPSGRNLNLNNPRTRRSAVRMLQKANKTFQTLKQLSGEIE